MAVKGPLKTHGGKAPLGRQLAAMLPRHLTYCEPFAGGLAVLMAKSPSASEVVNDVDRGLMNFWTVLRDPALYAAFARACQATPFSEEVWREACSLTDYYASLESPSEEDKVRRAYCTFVRCRMSLAGRGKSFTGVTKTRLRRGMNNEVSAWLSAVEGLPDVHARLKRVLLLCRDGLEVVRQFDRPDTVYYLDPPYHPETRAAKKVYPHEMTAGQHQELLALLGSLKAKFLLSGYRCQDYDTAAKRYGWKRADMDVPNHASGASEKRRMTESVWANFRI